MGRCGHRCERCSLVASGPRAGVDLRFGRASDGARRAGRQGGGQVRSRIHIGMRAAAAGTLPERAVGDVQSVPTAGQAKLKSCVPHAPACWGSLPALKIRKDAPAHSEIGASVPALTEEEEVLVVVSSPMHFRAYRSRATVALVATVLLPHTASAQTSEQVVELSALRLRSRQVRAAYATQVSLPLRHCQR